MTHLQETGTGYLVPVLDSVSWACFPKRLKELWRGGNLPFGDLVGKGEPAQGSSNGLRTIHALNCALVLDLSRSHINLKKKKKKN